MTASADPNTSDLPVAEKDKPKLNLEVEVKEPGTCKRHVTVTISRPDIDRYLKEAFDDLKPKAEVPGFRPGRAPRKLVESRFKEQITDQVKGSLLMDSMTQVNEECDFSAISEPEFDFDAVKLPEEGPMTFEFDIEVRPEFDVPEWKGLQLEMPVYEYSEDEVRQHTVAILGSQARVVTRDTAEASDDLLQVHLRILHDGKEAAIFRDQVVRLRPQVSFRDGVVKGFDEAAKGKSAGDKFTLPIELSQGEGDDGPQEAQVEFEIVEIRRSEPPELTPAFLENIGGFESADELYGEVRSALERQFSYHQQQVVRKQITEILTKDADWDLPPDLLRRQAQRELERAAMEMQSSGFGNDRIRAELNRMRQNLVESTSRALKEHFILERIAEENEIEAEPQDFDLEIQRIALQSDESPRRVRARLEKRGQMDTLRNQIIENKILDMIKAEATITETPHEPKVEDTSALDLSIKGAGGDSEIPEAKHAGQSEQLRTPADHT